MDDVARDGASDAELLALHVDGDPDAFAEADQSSTGELVGQ
ncbi:hypothetical protein [Streptomyces sp. NPDC049585]